MVNDFSRTKLKNQKNKAAVTIALVLVLSIGVFGIFPTVNAHTPPWQVPTFLFLTAAPNPIGVNQPTTIIFWLNQPPPTSAGSGGDRWRNIALEVTKPDGTLQSLGSFTSDDVGSCYTLFTPTQPGTYTFKVSFPGQVASLYGPTGIAGASSVYENDTFQPSTSSTTLTVQQAQIPQPPNYPLPTGYWTRPIEGQNTNWFTVASNWLSAPQVVYRFQPDGAAPNSAHILWAQPYEFGGVVGGSNTGTDGMTYYSGLNYEAKFQTPIIINGRLYYEQPLANDARGGGFVCLDLHTGEKIWEQNLTGITFGQLYDYESLNQHGVVPNGYLWRSVSDANNGGTVWMAYDPFTGRWLFNETNVPSGTQVYGPNGEILVFQMNYNARWLAMWNNTAAPTLAGALGTGSSAYQWRPNGKNVNASTAYTWNVTIPSLAGLSSPAIVKVLYDDLILGTSSTFITNSAYGGTQNPYTFWAINLNKARGQIGQLLWYRNYTAPSGNITRTIYVDPGWPLVDQSARVFVAHDEETRVNWGYSIDTGEILWGPSAPEANALGFYFSTGGQLSAKATAYGNLYQAGYGGTLYCYNLTTGKVTFTYGNGGAGNSTFSGLASPYGNFPIGTGAIADGKVYIFSSEHSPTSPYWKDALIRCIDAFTGKELWTTYGYAGVGSNNGMAVADGNMVYLNLYDNQLYCFGKGPSATTVSAPQTISSRGTKVVITGSVTDQSSGAKDTPAISDVSMGAWMAYLYMQKPKPTNATGVQVHLTAIDPNGNYQEIGNPTTDTNGNYGIIWTPPVEGLYKITATFAGTESYGDSDATTYMGVGPATQIQPSAQPTATVSPTPTQNPTPTVTFNPSPTPANPPTSASPTTTYVAIGIAVVIIIAAAAALIIRKRK
jgi:outer membrane protein assembly factor BamB